MPKEEFMNNMRIFQNGVVIVNTTPHPLTIQDMDGRLVTIPSDPEYVLNATCVEHNVTNLLVKSEFVGLPEGQGIILRIQSKVAQLYPGKQLMIVGSIIAAQAYPGQVVSVCPVPGYERVAPSEKRMRCDKFTVF